MVAFLKPKWGHIMIMDVQVVFIDLKLEICAKILLLSKVISSDWLS